MDKREWEQARSRLATRSYRCTAFDLTAKQNAFGSRCVLESEHDGAHKDAFGDEFPEEVSPHE